jgi:uncharacterized membrane protein
MNSTHSAQTVPGKFDSQAANNRISQRVASIDWMRGFVMVLMSVLQNKAIAGSGGVTACLLSLFQAASSGVILNSRNLSDAFIVTVSFGSSPLKI